MTNKSFNKTVLLRTSLIVNAVFILICIIYAIATGLVSSAELKIAEYNAIQAELCGDKYDTYLQKWAESHGEEGKKVFAATVCLRDYKTGKDLNIEPLITP